MNFLYSLIPSILVLGLLIIIHEWGHFIACRLTRVKVEKFSIGFGPEIFHWQGKETRYVIAPLPLGGFVKPAGETVSDLEGGVPKPGDYLAASVWVRIFIVISGVLMNYLLAFFLFACIFMTGRPVPGTTIGDFVEGYPAKTSGLEKGDKILEINGTPIRTWIELTAMLEHAPAGEVELSIERQPPPHPFPSTGRGQGAGRKEPIKLRVQPKAETLKDVFGESIRVKRLGIMPHPQAVEFERYGFFQSLKRAWDTELRLALVTHKAILYLVLGRLSVKTLTGPIGIINITGAAAQMGAPYMLHIAATLSVSLAVLNLLPIPALDGGHLLFLLIEAARRKRVNPAFQERATQVGFALLLTLMFVVIYNDLINLNFFEKLRGLLPH